MCSHLGHSHWAQSINTGLPRHILISFHNCWTCMDGWAQNKFCATQQKLIHIQQTHPASHMTIWLVWRILINVLHVCFAYYYGNAFTIYLVLIKRAAPYNIDSAGNYNVINLTKILVHRSLTHTQLLRLSPCVVEV